MNREGVHTSWRPWWLNIEMDEEAGTNVEQPTALALRFPKALLLTLLEGLLLIEFATLPPALRSTLPTPPAAENALPWGISCFCCWC
jgi:hypothetical protein